MIGVTQSASQPYTAVLTLGSLVDVRSPHALHYGPAATPHWEFGKPFSSDSVAVRLASRGVLGRAMSQNSQALIRVETSPLANTRARKPAPAAEGKRAIPRKKTRRAVSAIYNLSQVDLSGFFGKIVNAPPLEFEWDFGDGNVTTTASPTVVHDYFAAIDHASGIGQFLVTCNIKHAGISVRRTLTIYSAYADCKRSGAAVPHVTADLFAHKQYTLLIGSFTVHNVEAYPIVFDRVSVTPGTDDPNAPAIPHLFVSLGKHITIAAASSSMVGVNIPFVVGNPRAGQLRYDVKSFTVLYAGTAGGKPARCGATFDVPVAEWTKKPHSLDLPDLPDVPDLEYKPWPWEIVESAFEAIVDPAGAIDSPGAAVLDVKTGTLAVTRASVNRLQSRAPQHRCQGSVHSLCSGRIQSNASPANDQTRGALSLQRLLPARGRARKCSQAGDWPPRIATQSLQF